MTSQDHTQTGPTAVKSPHEAYAAALDLFVRLRDEAADPAALAGARTAVQRASAALSMALAQDLAELPPMEDGSRVGDGLPSELHPRALAEQARAQAAGWWRRTAAIRVERRRALSAARGRARAPRRGPSRSPVRSRARRSPAKARAPSDSSGDGDPAGDPPPGRRGPQGAIGRSRLGPDPRRERRAAGGRT
jgi:hypothetical protein